MGIRFRCPNGHKLHVKAFLAGKRGICPHCGEKFEIPLQSDPELAKASDHDAARPTKAADISVAEPKSGPNAPEKPARSGADVARLAADQPMVDVDAPARPTTQAAPADPKKSAPIDTAPIDTAPIDAAPIDAGPAATGPGETGPGTTGPSKASSVGTSTERVDPIDEAPHAVWYVRPPSGGQFGPASADVMRGWITEGRVTADSLVWREGWPEWKQAVSLFPGVSVGNTDPTVSAVPQIITNPADGSSAELYRRRKSNKSTLTVVFMLLVACVVLFGALVYVVKFMN